MAQLKITSSLSGLSPAEMQETASRYPYEDDGDQLDGDALDSQSIPLNRRILITPDDKVWSVGSRLTSWTDPRTSSVARSWQKKDAIERRKPREGWKGDIRIKKGGEDGPEYDRMMLSLSKVEAAELGQEGVEKVFRDFINAARQSPYGGTRLVEVEPVHTDTDHLHLHINLHRHGFDVATKTISRTVWMPELHTKEAARIAEALPDDVVLEYVAEKVAGAKASEEARQGAADAIRKAGGIPSPDMTGEGRHQVKQELPNPEMERISDAQRDIERRMAIREQEQQEDGALLAKIQHAAAALQTVEGLRADLDAEKEARATAEASLAATTVALQSSQADALAAAEKATQEATQADEILLQEQNRADMAEGLAVARFAEIETLQEVVKGEPERVALAIAAEADPLRDEVAQLCADLEAEKAARVTAVAELAEERRTFPERAKAWAEENLVAPLRQELAEAKAGFEKAQSKIMEQAAAIAAIPGDIAKAVREAEERMTATITATVQAALAITRNAAAAPFVAAGEAIRAKNTDEQNRAVVENLIDQKKPYNNLTRDERGAVLGDFSAWIASEFEADPDATLGISSPREYYAMLLDSKYGGGTRERLPRQVSEPVQKQEPSALARLEPAVPAPEEVQEVPTPEGVPSTPKNKTWRTGGVRPFVDLSPEEQAAAQARLEKEQSQGRVGKSVTVKTFTTRSQEAAEAKKGMTSKF